MSKFDKPVVFLPKGEALEACTEACQDNLGIEVPDFDGLRLSAETGDAMFFWLKPKDIPSRLAEKLGDVGFAGTDVVMEYAPLGIKSEKAGDEPMCDFSVLAVGEENRDELQRRINSDQRGCGLVSIPTGMPRTLSQLASFRELPLAPYGGGDFSVSGSVEAYAKLTGSIGVADLVQTGTTAEANGLLRVEKLLDIYPEQMEAA